MVIKIDQSGKIEYTSKDTIIAFSDGISKSILIRARSKRAIQKVFRESKKSHIFVYKTFALLIFLLIKDDLDRIDYIIIDQEYQGWEHLIKDFLLREIRNIQEFDKNNITFRRIGKHDNAHKRALAVYRKGIKPDKIVTAEDLKKFIK